MIAAHATPIGVLARIVRSKNAGPFQQTIDVLFDSAVTYEHVKASGVLTSVAIAKAYGVTTADVEGVYFWDPARAVKIVITRVYPAGSVGDNDCYGAQQHVPVLTLAVGAASVGADRR